MPVPDHFHRSLWAATAAPAPDLPPLEGAQDTNIAIVGGGILGLSLALHLAESGIACILLEAGEPGFGASGRNTGFVVPSLKPRFGPADLQRIYGAEQGLRLARLVGSAGDLVFDIVRRHGIACDAEPNGWLQPAHTDAGAAMLAARVAEWQAIGQPVRLLDRAAVAVATGAEEYRAALLDPTGGQLDPLAYTRGLARAAQRLGARLHAASAVRELGPDGAGWRLSTDAGTVRARLVFLATNALIGPLVPRLARSIVPVRTYQVATQPLGPNTAQRVLPGRQPLADLRNHTFALRWSADTRLVTGGLAVRNDAGAVDRMARHFLERIRRHVPGLPPLEPAFAWSGVIAATGDFLPRVFAVAPGLYAPIGCNGRGVALATAFGRELARFAATGDAGALPVPATEPRPWRFHGAMRLGPSFWLPWSRWKDAQADRRREG